MSEERNTKMPPSPKASAGRSKTAEREEEILRFWKENKIFEKTLEKESPKGEFVFYDGPPFATGEPHYGHILAGTMKDTIPRYKTMCGHHVRRVWGWDCHGLPIENLVEKELGLKSKKEIEHFGIEKFNSAARASVLRYEDVWKAFVPRSGRWVDMDKPYKTMDSSYTESVWWSFKTLFDKNWVYEGFKVMPYCPHCGTTLSNFEVNLGYKDVADLSVYVKFKIKDFPNAYFLAWTTTPWTLPGNTALAVGRDIEYVEAKVGNDILVLAKERLSIITGEYEIIATHTGSEMAGMLYEPLFECSGTSDLKNKENGWKVVTADFVTTEEGTGIVHIAPAFGGDDYDLSQKSQLPFIQHVDEDGKMKPEVVDFAGMMVKPKASDEKERLSTDIAVIRYLQEKGNYFDKKKIVHSYPHCWRCDTPLLNYATSSWFVKVTDLKDRMIELNKKIKWIPSDIGEGRFGKWLEGARDWAVSRSRFWGAPIPVWRDERGSLVVVGSLEDLKKYTKKNGNKYFGMRHGESEHNISGFCSADSKDPYGLTEKGKEEVKTSAEKLKDKKITKIISSPYVRTLQTAEVVAEVLGIPKEEIITDERIREFGFGDFHGKPMDEYRAWRKKEGAAATPSNGESLREARQRVAEFMYDLERTHAHENILIVSHGIVFEVIPSVVSGESLEDMYSHWILDRIGFAQFQEYGFVPLPHDGKYELDLHKPYIDQIELVDEKGQKLTRIKEVFDTWYDSGSMPYASVHYPFENKEEFEKGNSALFPADFIAEGLDQTRGWFYTLLVLGTGLFDCSPYENVIVNGIVLAEDGQKMSKRLKNYPDPTHILDTYGADSMRYYLLSSPAMRAEDLAFSEKGLDEIHKKIILRLENVLSFYEMYAGNMPMSDRGEHDAVLDRWLVARLNQTGEEITEALEKYELDKASRPILDFIDDFSTWYIRRSRDRFKSEDIHDKNAALSTTRFVLLELAKYMAPFTPFFAEHVYRQLKREDDPESVHLCNWPQIGDVDTEVLRNMEDVRNIVSLALEKRNAVNIKVRQPLSKLTVSSRQLAGREEYLELVKDEVNVKEVVFGESLELDTTITPELKREGLVREFIRAVQDLRKEKGLTPDQKITLLIETSEEGSRFIEEAQAEISKPTNIEDIKFAVNPGNEIKMDDFVFRIEIS